MVQTTILFSLRVFAGFDDIMEVGVLFCCGYAQLFIMSIRETSVLHVFTNIADSVLFVMKENGLEMLSLHIASFQEISCCRFALRFRA